MKNKIIDFRIPSRLAQINTNEKTKITVEQAYITLNDLLNRKPLDDKSKLIVDYLASNGYINTISAEDYALKFEEQATIIAKLHTIKDLKEKLIELKQDNMEIAEKYKGWFASIQFSLALSESIQNKKKDIKSNNEEIEDINELITIYQNEIEQRGHKIEYRNNFDNNFGQYMAISPKGQDLIKKLSVSLYRSKDKTIEVYFAEELAVTKKIDAQIEKYNDIYSRLSKASQLYSGEKLRKAALSLAKSKLDNQTLAQNFLETHQLLKAYPAGWNSEKNYGIMANIAKGKMDIKEATELLNDAFVYLVKNKMSDNYTTAKITGSLTLGQNKNTINEKLDKYLDLYRKYISTYYDSKTTPFTILKLNIIKAENTEILSKVHSLYELLGAHFSKDEVLRTITSVLLTSKAFAQKYDNHPDNIAKAYIDLYQELKKAYYSCDALKSVCATLISNDINKERFDEAVKYLKTHSGSFDSDYYAVAASIAGQPGTVKEAINIFDQTYKKIHTLTDRYSYKSEQYALTLQMMNAGYDVWKQNGVYKDIARSMNQYNRQMENNSNSGLNMSNAILGDLLDDGQLNFSSGFLFGAMGHPFLGLAMSGLFDQVDREEAQALNTDNTTLDVDHNDLQNDSDTNINPNDDTNEEVNDNDKEIEEQETEVEQDVEQEDDSDVDDNDNDNDNYDSGDSDSGSSGGSDD